MSLTYMREECATGEFYDALALLCVKYGGVVELTIVAGSGERDHLVAELHQRQLDARVHGASWQIFQPEGPCRTQAQASHS